MYLGGANSFISRASNFLSFGSAAAFGGVCLCSKFAPPNLAPSSYVLMGGLIGIALQFASIQRVIKEYVFSAQIVGVAQNPENQLVEIETRNAFGRPSVRTVFLRDLNCQSHLVISRISGRKFFIGRNLKDMVIKTDNNCVNE